MSTTTPIPHTARCAVLQQEIKMVRFLSNSGKDDGLRAAAGVRVLEIQKELADLEQAHPLQGETL